MMPPARLQALVSAKEANGDRFGIIQLRVGQRAQDGIEKMDLKQSNW